MAAEDAELAEERELEHDRQQQQQADAQERARREDHGSTTPAVCASARPAREHLDDVDRLQVGVRLDVDALVDVDLLEVRLATPRPIGIPRGKSDSPFEILNPEVTTVVFSVTAAALDEVEQQVARVAHRGPHDAGGAGGITCAPTPIEASVMSVTSAVPPVTLVTLPTRPPAWP